MENLDLLMEADKTIKDRISGALQSLVKWFRDKIEWAQRQFGKLRAKFSKGEQTPEKKTGFAKVKAGINGVIANCKKGLSACKSGAADKAATCKDAVMSHMSQIKAGAAVLGGAAAVAGTVAGVRHKDEIKAVAGKARDAVEAKASRIRNKFRREDAELELELEEAFDMLDEAYDGYDYDEPYFAEDYDMDYNYDEEYYAEDYDEEYDDEPYFAEDYDEEYDDEPYFAEDYEENYDEDYEY